MTNDNEAPSAQLDRRPAGFDDFVRELEASGELDLGDALDGLNLSLGKASADPASKRTVSNF